MSEEKLTVRWRGPEHGLEMAKVEFDFMCRIVKEGKRIIVGAAYAIPIGNAVIRVPAGQAIIARRATRAEFVQAALIQELKDAKAPFYYELRIVETINVKNEITQ